jgi:DHA2 family multidrug resistance protein
MRNEGTAMFNLMRNIGSSVGISAVQGLFVRNVQVAHATLSENVTPFSLAAARMAASAGGTQRAAMVLDGQINVQAAMIAYLDDFKLMLILTLLAMPLLLLIRSARGNSGGAHAVVE